LEAGNLTGQPEKLHRYLLDVENLKRQHPLLISVKQIGSEELQGGRRTALYEFVDQGSCCWILPARTTYKGQVNNE